jgi:hypothetical protein
LTPTEMAETHGKADALERINMRVRIAEFERTLSDWRERFALVEDGREFVAVPAEYFDALLRKP